MALPLVGGAVAGRSAEDSAEGAGGGEAEYAEGGDTTCLACHGEDGSHPVAGILKTPHAVRGDARTPLATGRGCEVCHGPSAAHVAEGAAPGQRFGPEESAVAQNAVCLGCHQGGRRMHWKGSPHEARGVACASCHTVHAARSALLERDVRPEVIARGDQTETCFACHPAQRAQMHRPSSHPIKEGRVRCSDCHNPHGSTGPSQLVRATLNETCYECHAEKRGPFLWEHQPAREDCSLCHTPHGSTHPALLKARAPWLCQQCHLAQRHPSTEYSGGGLPSASPSRFLLAQSCLNCHAEVHGSNHPSGVRFMR